MKHQVDTKPHWMDSTPLPSLPRLERARKADIVVVGAGITGLTTAYLLTRAGRKVAVLERDEAVEHDTAHTSAHLSMVTDAWLGELVDRFGRDHAQAAWDAGLAAIAQIDTIVREEDIACDFAWVPGYLHGADRSLAEAREICCIRGNQALLESCPRGAFSGFGASCSTKDHVGSDSSQSQVFAPFTEDFADRLRTLLSVMEVA